MKRSLLLLIFLQLSILGASLIIPHSIPPAHAQVVGKICLTDPGFMALNGVPCPTDLFLPAQSFSAANSPNKQLKVAVNIDGGDPLLSYSIILWTNHTYLKPADASISGSILGMSGVTIVKCIGTIPKIGSFCDRHDTPDTIEVAAGTTGGAINMPGGLLFTATFNITGVPTRGSAIGFQVGCGNLIAPTSTPSSVCVTVASGALTPNVETVELATFNPLSGGVNSFSILPSPPLVTVIQGKTNTTSIGALSLFNFTGTVTLTSTALAPGPTVSFNPTGIRVATSSENSTTATISTTALTTLGLYNIAVLGTSGTLTNSTSFTVKVVLPDFTIAATQTSLTIDVGSAKSSAITLKSINTFNGTVSLAASMKPSGPTASFNPTSVKINTTYPTQTSTLSVSLGIWGPAGTYTVNVTGTSGSLVHFVIVTVTVPPPDFSIAASPTTLTALINGPTVTSTITLTSINGFANNVDLTLNTSPNTGLNCATTTPNPAVLSPSQVSTATLSCAATSTTTPATYTVTITGTNRSTSPSPLSHSTIVTVTVPTPGFNITSTPTTQVIIQGKTGTFTLGVNSLGGFTGNVALTTSAPTGLSATLNATSVTLTSGGSRAVTLSVNASITITPGSYIVHVNATSTSLIYKLNITLSVAQGLPNLVIQSITVSPNNPTAGQTVTISVTVANTGNVPANNFWLLVKWGGVTVGNQTETLATGQTRTFTLTWDTRGYNPDTRQLTATTSTGTTSQPTNLQLYPAPANLFSGNNLFIIIGAIVAAVAVISAILLFRRRRKTPVI